MIWQVLDSSGFGGIERHVEVLASGLAGRGYACEVRLLADHGPHPLTDRLHRRAVAISALTGGLGGLSAAARRDRPILIHAHGYKASLIARLVCTALRIPLVTTSHAGERAPFPVSLYQTLDDWSGALFPRIAVSPAIAARLPGASTLIRNFVEAPSAPAVGPVPRRVGFVGRLSAEKGPDIFCDLARRLDELAEWHVYGDGPMAAALRAEHGRRIVFHGAVVDMAAVWPTLGLLVMPSRAEGLPMAALEAMAAGVPVVAAAVGALPDLIADGHDGWLVHGGHATAFEAPVRRWFATEDHRQLRIRRAAQETIRAGYGVDRGIDAVLAVYRRALRRSTTDLTPSSPAPTPRPAITLDK